MTRFQFWYSAKMAQSLREPSFYGLRYRHQPFLARLDDGRVVEYTACHPASQPLERGSGWDDEVYLGEGVTYSGPLPADFAEQFKRGDSR